MQSNPTFRRALVGLALAALLSSLGTSVANVALPTLAGAFGASFQGVRWVVVAYLLALTTSIVGVGRLGDLHGRRPLLLGGLVVFTAGSLASGLAPTLGVLVAARAAQGLGAAAMMALTMAFVSQVVPKERTGTAMGLLGTTSAIGTALGPSVGGLLIAGLGWRALFLVQVPLGLLALWLLHRTLPEGARAASPRLGFAALDRVLGARLATNVVVSGVMMTTLVVGPFYLSRALGLDAAAVGLVMAVGPVVAALTGAPAGRLVDRLGGERTTVVGLVGVTLGALALAVVPDLRIAGYLAPIVVLTASYALFQAANTTAVMKDVDADRRGVVAALLNLSRHLGLVVGAWVMGALFALASGTDDVAVAPPEHVAAGMRITFAVAAALVAVAASLAVAGRASRRSAFASAMALLVLAFGSASARAGLPEGPRLVGLLQIQVAHVGPFGAPVERSLLVNRARLGVQGALGDGGPRYAFVTDFGRGDVRLVFAYLDQTVVPRWLAIRVGRMKRPFSRSFLTPSSHLAMIDRPFTVGPAAFGDDLDVGVMAHDGGEGPLEYAVGVFGGRVPGSPPDGLHAVVVVRGGVRSGGRDPLGESDLEGGPPRWGVGAAALAEVGADDGRAARHTATVDASFRAYGLSVSTAFHASLPQRGDEPVGGVFGHTTQVGVVLAGRVEPVVRYAFLRPAGDGDDRHELAFGLNGFVRGHALEVQTGVSVPLGQKSDPDGEGPTFKAQLGWAF